MICTLKYSEGSILIPAIYSQMPLNKRSHSGTCEKANLGLYVNIN